MTLKEIKNTILIFVLLSAASTTGAEENPLQLKFEAAAGAQHDSNVGIPELDSSSGESDSSVELSAGLGVTYSPADNPLALRLGYDYAGTSYNRFSEYDLSLHHSVAEVQFNNKHIDAALTFDRYEGILDGEDYVSISRVSPSIGHLFGDRLYLRAAWVESSRDYATQSERSGDSTGARLDAYLLFDGLEHYLALGMQAKEETTELPEFEYSGFQSSLTYGRSIRFPLMRLKLKGTLRFEERDYRFDTPAIGERRQDSRMRLSVSAEVPFTEHVALRATLERTDNESNLESAALQKAVAGIELRVSF